MKICVFLILLLGFIQLVYCSLLENVTEDVCPVTWFRRKRANIEYTRWRNNIDTTAEFIVKVLDDDVATTTTNQIMAVNIQPLTKRGEKIIVGGAMVPPPTSPSSELPRDYTRFVPPTTTMERDLYLSTPKVFISDDIPPIRPDTPPPRKDPLFLPPSNARRNLYRDESPPVSPQFIPRGQPTVSARQYAPIAPVAFTRRTTVTPMTPPPYDGYMDNLYPTRSPSYHRISPSRTLPSILRDLPIFQAFLQNDGDEAALTRTTLKDIPGRTTHFSIPSDAEFSDEDFDHFHTTTKKTDDVDIKTYDEESSELEKEHRGLRKDNKDSDREIDTSYNNMFVYNEDYKDINNKKVLDYITNDEDKSKIQQKSESSKNFIDRTPADVVRVGMEVITSTESQYPDDSYENPADNITNQSTPSEGKLMRASDEMSTSDKNRPVCNMIKLRQLNFNSPRTLPEIVAQLKQWAEESPSAKWADITAGNLTTMENPIYIMTVDDPSAGQVPSEKQNVLLVAGIQGRDHHSVAAAMYVLYQLIERSETHRSLHSKYRFWIIPVFNPDGYDYSMTFPHRRDWMKNLRQTWDICKGRDSCQNCEKYGIRCTISPCYGVNLDRNFEYQWIPTEELRAEHPCGNLYAGTRQLSEAETQALTIYLHRRNMRISIFIAFKEGDVLGVMYPYSHTRKKRAFDQVYRQRASRAAASANSVAGRQYFAGQTSEYLPLYAGGIEDWADGHLGIDNVYTVMMYRPSDRSQSKILTERVIHEAYAALDTLLQAVSTNSKHRSPELALVKSNAQSFKPCAATLFLTGFASFLLSLYHTHKFLIT